MTEKKRQSSAKAKKDKAALDAAAEFVGEKPQTEYVSETYETGFEMPAKGPDYHITDAGEILLDSGGPIPEDHHVHPAHRLLALARKDARGKS